MIKSNIINTLLTAIFATLVWWGITPLTQFIMFVPLLMIQKNCKGVGFMKWAILSLMLWNLSALWWIGRASIAGPIGTTVVFTSLFSIVLALYNQAWSTATKPLAYTILVSGWIAMEWFYGWNSEVSFPWLNLGNSFGITPSFVQWYEYCGSLGGTLWVLIVNILIFEAYSTPRKGKLGFLFSRKFLTAMLLITAPTVWSINKYNNYEAEGKDVNVAILQPNVDPYIDKHGGLSQREQQNILLDLAEKAPNNTDFYVTSESALNNNFWVHSLNENISVRNFRYFLTKHNPDATFILGALLRERYMKSNFTTAPTYTARTTEQLPFYYDTYNSVLAISEDTIGTYYKSRLVAGVEMMPFYKQYREISDAFVSIGGKSYGMFASQPDREIFENKSSGVEAGVAICYEAVYGEFFSQFVKNGAEIMFIISDDGWWGDTPGYHQLLSFSSLRAIETRRYIGRSANTGISAVIDSKGEILEHTEWDERTAIYSTLKSNDKITLYVKYGDYIGRISLYIALLSLLFLISYSYKKKSHLSYENFNKTR